MSQWTHVSGCIRIDGIPAVGLTPNIKAILGTPSDQNWESARHEQGSNIPGGSEGTLQYGICDAGDGAVWKTVAIWGDLRDFGIEDCQEIDDWFDRIVSASHRDRLKDTKLMLRAAHLLVRVEYGIYLLVMQGEEDGDAIITRIEVPSSSTGET